MPALPSFLAVPDPQQQEQQEQQMPSYPFHLPDSLPVVPTDHHGFELLNIWKWPTPAILLWCVIGLVVFGAHAERFRMYLNTNSKGRSGSGSLSGWKRWGWRSSASSRLSERQVLWVVFALAAGMYLFFWPVFLVGGFVPLRLRPKKSSGGGGASGGSCEEGRDNSRFMHVMLSPPPSYGYATMGGDDKRQTPLPQPWASRVQMTTMSTPMPNQGKARMGIWSGLPSPSMASATSMASRMYSPPSYNEATAEGGSSSQEKKNC